jgi:hypothetical protein
LAFTAEVDAEHVFGPAFMTYLRGYERLGSRNNPTRSAPIVSPTAAVPAVSSKMSGLSCAAAGVSLVAASSNDDRGGLRPLI